MKLVQGSIYLKQPQLEDLQYTKLLWEDEETMAFNQKWGGTVMFPQHQWQDFYNLYCTNNPDYIYFHIYNLDHVFVGEISAKRAKESNIYSLNIKIYSPYRGNHHAIDAVTLFVEYLFDEIEADCIIDDVASDNEGAIMLLHRCGFHLKKQDQDITLFELCKPRE